MRQMEPGDSILFATKDAKRHVKIMGWRYILAFKAAPMIILRITILPSSGFLQKIF